MPDITDSVGETGKNQPHDVAMVQAMLKAIKNAKGAPYLTTNYDGAYGKNTKAAIIAFQTDHKTTSATGDTAGLIKAGGATMGKINDLLPADRKTMRIVEGMKTVYLEGDATVAKAKSTAVAADVELDVAFRAKIAQLIDSMFATHKIVLSIAPQGGRRTFAQQAALSAAVTGAGPGESNHNFGMAVDIGFDGIKWLQGDGTVKSDDSWLNSLSKVKAAEFNKFWEIRNDIALKAPIGVFKTKKAGDLIHLQNFDDTAVSYGRSLATLLDAVGAFRWQAQAGSPNSYKTDLGGGAKSYNVGTSKQIWAENATVTKAMLAELKTAKEPLAGGKPKKVWKEADIKATDLTAMKKTLKGEFETAEAKRATWKAVP
jgi:hypothetical protein